jgi:hypothetical protein
MFRQVLDRIPDFVIDEDLFQPYPGNLLMTGVVSMPATFTRGSRRGDENPLLPAGETRRPPETGVSR